MDTLSRVLFPAIRYHAERGFRGQEATIADALELGVGGFIVFGGPADEVRALIARIRSDAGRPLLFGADLERGAGQQFAGATPLPPARALGVLDDPAGTRRAAELTAREARALGVDWVYAPVADIDLEPANPIIGTRAFADDAAAVARQLGAWIAGCRLGGALSCAKHFPGMGRVTADSHLELPRVDADRAALETDLAPFRAAIAAGVDSIMTAHVAYPALDGSGAPATLSGPIIRGVLREELGYDGLVVTDALTMEGVRGDGTEGELAVRALAAGCDALLYPADAAAMAGRLEDAVGGALPEARARAAIDRVRAAAERAAAEAAAAAPGGEVGETGDLRWALRQAGDSLRAVRGAPRCPPVVQLVTVDDDVGGPFPAPPRAALARTLRERGVTVHEVDRPGGALPVVVAVYADIKGYKGRPGLSRGAAAAAGEAVTAPAVAAVVFFGHPRSTPEVPGADVLLAWGGEPLMQRAAGHWLADHPGDPAP